MRRPSPRSVVLGVCALIALMISSCDFRVERSPDVLTTSLLGDPTILNPVLATDAYAQGILSYIYQGLLDLDIETMELVPMLAERWEASEDHLSYTYWIREGVRWQDGTPFTVDDVLFTFETILDPKVDAARLRNYFRNLKAIERVGDRGVRFVFTEPYFRAHIMCGRQPIIPKHIFGDGQEMNSHPANRTPVGTGPYRFAEWKTGQRVRLDRFEGYWGDKPAIRGIVYKIIPEQVTAFQLMRKGGLDADTVSAVQWARQTEDRAFNERFSKHRFFPPNYFFVAWNNRKPYFSDPLVRRAMTMLIDREAIVRELLFGQGHVIDSSFYLYGREVDRDITPLPYDPAQAVKLLDASGWIDHDGDGIRDKDGTPFRFVYLYPAESRLARSIGIFMREDLAKVGIDCEPRQIEWATLLKLLGERNYDATQLGYTGQLESDPFQVWHSSQAEAGSNLSGFADARADALIEEARRTFDRDRRIELYREFQRIVHAAQPVTFLFTSATLEVVDRRFTDVVDYPMGLDLMKWGIGPSAVLYEW